MYESKSQSLLKNKSARTIVCEYCVICGNKETRLVYLLPPQSFSALGFSPLVSHASSSQRQFSPAKLTAGRKRLDVFVPGSNTAQGRIEKEHFLAESWWIVLIVSQVRSSQRKRHQSLWILFMAGIHAVH